MHMNSVDHRAGVGPGERTRSHVNLMSLCTNPYNVSDDFSYAIDRLADRLLPHGESPSMLHRQRSDSAERGIVIDLT